MSDLHEARDPKRGPNRHYRLAIFGLWCRDHSRRCDGGLQGQHDYCERPCVARALATVPPQVPQLRDIRFDPTVAREQFV
jgi:hypothetical protein